MGRLVVFTHKILWRSDSSPSGYATDGGFPKQMMALAAIFERTEIIAPLGSDVCPVGLMPVSGHNLTVTALSNLTRCLWLRRLLLLPWLIRNTFRMGNAIVRADVVHSPIPGDIGSIGMILAFVLRKPLFIRYCGNWGARRTVAEKSWHWFMERYATGRTVAMATGMRDSPPSIKNPNIRWVFSTSLRKVDMARLAKRRSLPRGGPIRLISVGRQEPSKGTASVIEAMPLLLEKGDFCLDVVGDGSDLSRLQRLANDLPNGAVTFHGQVDHERVYSLLDSSHIFCFPTLSEGFPKALLEAMAHGLPSISSPVSAIPEMLRDGAGILLERNEAVEIVRSVVELSSDERNYTRSSEQALVNARDYTLERWQESIFFALADAWKPLGRRDLFKKDAESMRQYEVTNR